MKNPNELTLGQMIILENEYNDIVEEIQNLEKYVAENDSHEGAAYRILHCTGALSEVSKIAKQYKISKKVGRAYVTALANKAAKYYGYTVTKTTTKSGDKVYTLKSADKTYKLTKGKTAYTVTENGYGYCREYLGI